MKTIFEKSDVAARQLLATKTTPDGQKFNGLCMWFVGFVDDTEPSENPCIFSDVITIPAVLDGKGVTHYVGSVDFTGGWKETLPATELHSEYVYEVGDTVRVPSDIFAIYKKKLSEHYGD